MLSLIYPRGETGLKAISDTACHDLGIDSLVKALSEDREEQRIIYAYLSKMTADPYTAAYRSGVFNDIYRLPGLRESLTELFGRIEYLSDYGMRAKNSGERLGIWYFLHRLDELNSYIQCVEAIRDQLIDADIRSEGLIALRDHISSIYDEKLFAEMKADITALRAKTADIRSVTLGINLNDRFEAVSMGLVSVNSKPFKKSGVVSSFADAMAGDRISDTPEDTNDMRFHQVYNMVDTDRSGHERLISRTMVRIADGDGMRNSTYQLNDTMNRMIDRLVKLLSETLAKYVNVAVMDIKAIIPEFMFYIRAVDLIKAQRDKGRRCCTPVTGDIPMDAKGFYDMKLALNTDDDIVPNDLIFDKDHTVYILTGANRGGKTTLTQAVGLLYVMAQAGLDVPADSFEYAPVDCIYTHFPADEDKTLDLGRLGEECVRFKEIWSECTSDSLILLNETFSTTSFEEGLYIAKDAVKAIISRKVRTIYNTHMHKLARDADELSSPDCRAVSLVVRTEAGSRLYKAVIAPPEGSSYARDIAEKYGVTYEDLVRGREQ
ncbi:MAG: DNA mismatch repair protein [Oscillospiraceae bacterium]|nr:DNA mismatch repair protein [Oscillospiraceae bacterium]